MPASSVGGSEVFDLTTDRRTLLDVVLDDQKAASKVASSCSRLVYVASLAKRDNSAEPYAVWSEALLNRATGGSIEGVTGMMVVYPTCLMQLLEASPSILHKVMEQLAVDTSAETNIASTRVLLCTEGCERRFYSSRLAAFVSSASNSTAAEAADGFPDAVSFVAAAGQVLKALLAMGATMSELKAVEVQQHLESLPAYHPDVPAGDTIAALAASKVAPSVSQHLHIYSTAHKLPLAREKCWPAPAAVPTFLMGPATARLAGQ